jgi:16S rRNA (cytidine1402-2'-O)-methyltransferase
MTSPNSHKGTLFIVSTPIGNLSDMTPRAIDTLKGVDLVASEDTRVSGRLLAHFGINAAQTSYHDHNERQKAPELIERLMSGKSIALISDAGTPLVSDPGYRLVNAAHSNGIDVVPIPGASSILAALVVSGFPNDRFCFEGYLPKSRGKLVTTLARLAGETRTMIFLETTFRVSKSLPVILEVLGDREIFIARELTKKFEEKIRGRLSRIIPLLQGRSLKGEIVIIVHGAENG